MPTYCTIFCAEDALAVAVLLRGVEVVDSLFDGFADDGDGFCLAAGILRHARAAQREDGHPHARLAVGALR